MSVDEVVIAPRSPIAESVRRTTYRIDPHRSLKNEQVVEILGSYRFHPTLGKPRTVKQNLKLRTAISGNPVSGNITRGVSRQARPDFSNGLEIFLAIGGTAFCGAPFRFRTKPVGC
jgi:hypothetical protein